MAVVEGTTGELWGSDYQARLLKQSSLEDAINLVLEDKAEGAIFDRPALAYYLAQHPDVDRIIAANAWNEIRFPPPQGHLVNAKQRDLP